MVMMAEPLQRCLEAIRADRVDRAPVVLFSPTGEKLDHVGVAGWASGAGAVLICGRYEGLDQRFIDQNVDVQISVGDFVLSGGEIAALALLDAVARLQPGVLNDEESHQFDSFNPALDGLLDCPITRGPKCGRGKTFRKSCCRGIMRRSNAGAGTAGSRPPCGAGRTSLRRHVPRGDWTKQMSVSWPHWRQSRRKEKVCIIKSFSILCPAADFKCSVQNAPPCRLLCSVGMIPRGKHESDPDSRTGRNCPSRQDHP